MDETHDSGHRHEKPPAAASRAKWAFVGFATVAAFFLFTVHRAHLFGALLQWPTLVTLAMFSVLVFV